MAIMLRFLYFDFVGFTQNACAHSTAAIWKPWVKTPPICYRNYELYVKDVELAADVQAGVFGTGKKSFVV